MFVSHVIKADSSLSWCSRFLSMHDLAARPGPSAEEEKQDTQRHLYSTLRTAEQQHDRTEPARRASKIYKISGGSLTPSRHVEIQYRYS
jgi:hypothetical protein